jgi:hypothetical protein
VPVGGAASGNTDSISQGGELGYYAPYQTVEEFDDNGDPFGTDFGDLTMHNIEADPLTAGVAPGFSAGPRMFVSWYSLGMRALEYRPGHFHDNSNDEGSNPKTSTKSAVSSKTTVDPTSGVCTPT